MASPRNRGVAGRGLIVLAAILALLALLVIAGAVGSASEPQAGEGKRMYSRHFDFSSWVPSGWHPSFRRLVPNLLDPREIVSLGTFATPVSGGGNCGREPTAAIRRMRTGDALVSVQEFARSASTPWRLRQTPTLASYSGGAGLELRREPRVAGAELPASRSLWSATLPFRADGRSFDALLYVKGPPSHDRIEQIVSILQGLDFRPGTYVRRPS